MKTFLERKAEFIVAVKKLAEEMQIGMIATCDAEQILGEITIFDWSKNDCGTNNMKKDAFNFE